MTTTSLSPELKELMRVLVSHPEVLEVTLETKCGRTFEVKYPSGDAVKRSVFEVEIVHY